MAKEDSIISIHQESNEQKTEEINAIRTNIMKYHLGKFCKANANALALIFKALIRGEAIYSKVQFLQDSQTNSLLCQKVQDSNQGNPKEPAQESKIGRMYHKKESKINKKDSLAQPSQSPKHQEIQKPKEKVQSKKDSKDSIQETESIPDNPATPFPLNIEG
ncbi:hypothetical protein [Helicobacter sp.]|uniref:hypothetical protein n=1 Tax=Helicobacter sp. TaxID=218 RepID=UPI0019BFAA22|nr:hypothetical protein [Helicobacter sp.]MBD5165483.1 hypothetical protein [Helicobacter sp.]